MKKILIIPIFFIINFIYSQQSWYRQIPPIAVDFYCVHFPNDTLVGFIVGDNGKILRTTNSGNNWEEIPSGVREPLRDIWSIGDTIYICGDNSRVLKSIDGGSHWNIIGDFIVSHRFYTIFFPENGTIGYLFGEGGAAYKTTNGGTTWLSLNLGVNLNIYGSYFINNQIGFVVGDNGLILKTTNGGTSWERYSPTPAVPFHNVWFANENVGYTCGENGWILKTTNGGNSWFNFGTIDPIFFQDIIFPTSPDTGYTCALGGIIGKTTGIGWNFTIVGNVDLLSIHFPQNNKVGWCVGRQGIILKTSTGGEPSFVSEEKKASKIKNLNNYQGYEVYNSLGTKLAKKNLKKGIYFIKNNKLFEKKLLIN